MKKLIITFITLVSILFFSTAPSKASAMSFHSHSMRSHSTFHAPRVKSTPRYKLNRPKSSNKIYNQRSNTNYNSNKKLSMFSGFGRSIVHGAGWSIGSNMGNSLWHTMFGFGGNSYYDQDNRQYQQRQGGYFGWIIIAIIAFVIWRLVRKNHRRY